jgi:ABC-2 type transport system permease protein
MLPALSLLSLARAALRRHGAALAGALVTLGLALALLPAFRVRPLATFAAFALAASVIGWLAHRRGPPQTAAVLFMAVFAAGFAALLYWFFFRVFQNLATLEELSAPEHVALRTHLIAELLTLVLSLAFTLLCMSMPAVALSAVYLAGGAAPLLLAPRHPVATFGARFSLAATRVSYMALGVLVPCLLALGQVLGAGAAYYALVPVLLFMLLTPPLVLGCGATALLIRFFPVRRLQQVLSVLTLVALAGVIILVRAADPEQLLSLPPAADARAVAGLLEAGGLSRLPGGWTATAVMAAAEGAFAWPALARLALATVAALGVGAALARGYARTYARAQERTAVARTSARAWPRAPVALLWVKDVRLFARDAKEWSQLLMLAALVVLYLYNIHRMPVDVAGFGAIVAFINLGVLGFMLAALNLRFTFSAMALEGPGLWTLLKAPVPRSRLLWAKVLFTLPPLAGFGVLLTLLAGAMLHLPRAMLALNLGVALLYALVLHPLALAFGLKQYRPPEDDPVRMALSPGGLLYLAASFCYVLLGLALSAPAVLISLGRQRLPLAAVAGPLAGLVVVSAGLAATALWYARRRLERMEC